MPTCQVFREDTPNRFTLIRTVSYPTLREAQKENPGLRIDVYADCPNCGEGSYPDLTEEPDNPVVPCFECGTILKLCAFYELTCVTCRWRINCLVIP